MVFVSGGQTAQDNESFFNVTLLNWAIEGQNNESYRKKEKYTLFEKFPTKGGGGFGAVGIPTFTGF